jgi:hypothetical protein
LHRVRHRTGNGRSGSPNHWRDRRSRSPLSFL